MTLKSTGPNRPLVSVIAVCYNHERFVLETLDSIVGQIYDNFELIIIDDCSQDDSVETIRGWVRRTGVDCRIFAHDQNRGLCRTLNEGLRLSRGRYVQMVACDDVLSPLKFATQVDQLESQPECVLACSNFRTIDESGVVLSESYFPEDFSLPTDPFVAVLEGLDGLKIVIHSPTALVRRSAIEDVGGYREDLLQEDFFMWLSLTEDGNACFSNNCLVDYRQLPDSLSAKMTLEPTVRKKYLRDQIEVVDRFLRNADSSREKALLRYKVLRLTDLENFHIDENSKMEIDEQYLASLVKEKRLIGDLSKSDESFVDRTVSSVITKYLGRFEDLTPAYRRELHHLPLRYRITISFKWFIKYLKNFIG